MSKTRQARPIVLCAATCVCVVVLSVAKADLIIIDDNSTITIDPNSQAGMHSWVVDGQDQLNQQWLWYRTAGMTKEESIDTLTLAMAATSDPDFDNVDELAFLRYTKPGVFKIELYLLLNGGAVGSQVSDLAESIEITNLSTSDVLKLSFFQYCD